MGRFPDEHLQALEQKRQDVADLRRIWIGKRQPFMARHLERLVFIDETSVKTNMAKTTGWAPRGQRLTGHAPFGHWRTQTFIGALRHDRLDAAWVIDGAMNSERFDLYVTSQLVPTLRTGDVFGPLTRTGGVRGLTPRQPVEPQKPRRSPSLARHRRVVPLFGVNAPPGPFLPPEPAAL